MKSAQELVIKATTPRQTAIRLAVLAAVAAAAAAVILLAAGGRRFTLACVLPFAFAASFVPALTAGLYVTKKPMAGSGDGGVAYSIPGIRGVLDAAAMLVGVFVITLALAPGMAALIAVIMTDAFACLIAGITVALSLVLRPALAAVFSTMLAFAGLASPFIIGPLLKYSGGALRDILLALAYWLNPMAVSTHAGLGFDFFRIRGGPLVIYNMGVDNYVYPYPSWWAVAILHAAVGVALFTAAAWLGSRRLRAREADHAV
ncbi:MAG: hypothetical protein ACYS8W_20465 [Planctomycetota bacterium]|jgi:hypothetical protein